MLYGKAEAICQPLLWLMIRTEAYDRWHEFRRRICIIIERKWAYGRLSKEEAVKGNEGSRTSRSKVLSRALSREVDTIAIQ